MADEFLNNQDPELENQEPEEGQEPELEGQEQEEGQEGNTTQGVVPLKTHLETKKQMKELKKRLAKLEDRDRNSRQLEYRDQVRQKYLDAGYEENLADMLAGDLAEIREISAAKRSSEDDLLDDEINEMASTDEYYMDAADYADSIKAKIKDFSKKGIDLSVEDAYSLVANHKQKAKGINANNRQRVILENKKAGVSPGTTNVPTAGGYGIKTQYKLDADDKKALANLQQLQPDAKWTPEKYFKIMK